MHLFEMIQTIADAIEGSAKVKSVAGDMILHVTFKDKSECAVSFVTSKLAQLNIAKVMYDGGASQVELRKMFGHSVGIKYYFILVLNKKYPKLKILKRCQNGSLHVPTIHHRNLQMLRFSKQVEVATYFRQVERIKKQKFDLINFD